MNKELINWKNNFKQYVSSLDLKPEEFTKITNYIDTIPIMSILSKFNCELEELDIFYDTQYIEGAIEWFNVEDVTTILDRCIEDTQNVIKQSCTHCKNYENSKGCNAWECDFTQR